MKDVISAGHHELASGRGVPLGCYTRIPRDTKSGDHAQSSSRNFAERNIWDHVIILFDPRFRGDDDFIHFTSPGIPG